MSTLRDAMSHAALGWVKPELDETLRQVRNEVEYFAEDPAGTGRMEVCAGHLHQVQGTLRMVELYAPAMVAEELEQLARSIGAGEVLDRDEACSALMRGSVLLPDYLERLQNGHRDIPIVLLPLLNEIRAARGAPGINESVLFAFAPDSISATQAEVEHARGSLSGRNRELLDTVGNAVKEELLRIKDALDLHLRTGGMPQQLQQQVDELTAVGDTLGMMGLGVARNVVVQQRDALAAVAQGQQQIDESLLLDIAGALLYVDASLDDQVAHLGAVGNGEDDPAAAETRRTVEVLAHEAIANFTAAREHFVAFIETNWNHAELQDVPRLLGEVAGALRMLDLGTSADYLRGVQQYIDVELVTRQRVPSGRQLDTLADAMASMEYYLEALRDRRPGREDILEITRSSLEALRYWPLPAPADDTAPAETASSEATGPQPVQRQSVPPPLPTVAPPPMPELTRAPAPLLTPGSVPPPLPDFTFDPLPSAPALQDHVAAPAGNGTSELVFAAALQPPPEQSLWQLDTVEPARPAKQAAQVPTFTAFDPVNAEDEGRGTPAEEAASDTAGEQGSGIWQPADTLHPGYGGNISDVRWDLQSVVADADAGGAPAGSLSTFAPVTSVRADEREATGMDTSPFDPVMAEVALDDSAQPAVSYVFDDGVLSHADGVLALDEVEATPPGMDMSAAHDAPAAPVPASMPGMDEVIAQWATAEAAATSDAGTAEADADVQSEAVQTMDGVEIDPAHARFLAELDAAAAAFNPLGDHIASAAPEPQAAASAPAPAPVFDAGFDDQAENIDQDIRDVFLEEFEDEMGNLASLVPAWRAQPDNIDRLRPIRRVFHTLKGSGRLVGARTLGEFAWKLESMLNRVLDGSRSASPAVVAMVEQAQQALPELHAALANGQAVSVDIQALQAVADRVAEGEETWFVPLPATPSEDPDAAAAAVEEAAAPVGVVDQHEPMRDAYEGTPAHIDDVLREILEAEVQAHLVTLRQWLEHGEPQVVEDPLLRAMHTMNGAFAMTDVPEITAVTAAAESYIKRALAAGITPSSDAVHALQQTAAAIETTMQVLQQPQPRVPAQHMLAARLQALADTLPEARWPAMAVDEDDLPGEAAGDEDLVVDAAADDIQVPATVAVPQLDAGAEPEWLQLPETVAERELDLAQDAVQEVDTTAAPDAIQEPDTMPEAVVEPDILVEGETPPAADTLMEEAFVDTDTEADLGLEDGAEGDKPREFDAPISLEQALEEGLHPLDAPASELQPALAPHPHVVPASDAEPADGHAPMQEAVADTETDLDLDEPTEQEEQRDFDAPVSLEQALEEGLHLLDEPASDVPSDAALLTVHGLEDAESDRATYADDADAAGLAPYEAASEPAAAPAPFFEMEVPGTAAHAPVVQPTRAPAATDALDFSVLDRELVDIFVEEGNDLLDHCDGLVSALRETPDDRDVLADLQRDLHTLKGGARMAGINAIGDLGHGIESLLEAVAAGRTRIELADVQLLERGFDRLHKQLMLTGEHRQATAADDLLDAFEQRTLGPSPAGDDADAAAGTALPAVVHQPLSAPLAAESGSEDDPLARPQQEQVRVRADLLDRLVNHAGEVAIYRSRLEQQLGAFRGAMGELERTNARLRDQLRRLDLETEAQIVARYQREQDQSDHAFDPLELDRFSTLQQLSRALNESAADLGGLQGVLDDLSRQYDGLLQQQSRVSSELQDGLMRARMVPFDGLVPRLRRVVRQAGIETGKQVHLTLEGTHGELDRNVLDRMVAPLEHMLRNSVAHGLETPEQRRAAGKPAEGEIALRLRREGSEIVLEVADDGAGLDREAIQRRAVERGLLDAGAEVTDTQLDNLIFASGFSTVDQVSQLAGRGVGMDVVHNEVRQLGGSVDIVSVRGQGVRFTLRLPQTLAVTQAVFVQIGETSFAVPVASVSGIGRIARERFEAGDSTYRYSGEDYSLYDLGSLVGQAAARADGQHQVPLLLVRAGDLRAAVAVDQVVGNREIVVKPVGLQIASVPGIYGATITGDGRVVVILDVAPLVRRYQANPQQPLLPAAQAQQRQVPLVMVVDDSLTMRKVTGRILERHNFEVSVARDGVEALECLEERVPDLMLLDIEMPRMDGYELATAMRADPRYREVPIVMITSRSGEKHRQRAFEIGVQRYLGKPYQELDLMRNVYDLLGIARART